MHVIAYNVLIFFFSQLQMAASQYTVSMIKKKLEDKIKKKQTSLKALKDYIKPEDNEIICVLEEKKLEKEKELKNSYVIQCMSI